MTFERSDSWEYIDDDEYGGMIEVSGILRCSRCASSINETFRVKAPDMLAIEASGKINVDLEAATRLAEATERKP
jgi:hypothetical protein